MWRKLFPIITFSLLSFSCEKTIEVDFNSIDMVNSIVIQAYLNSETDIEAYVYKTLKLNNVNGNPYLSSPNVWLYKNDTAYTQLHETDSSLYVLDDTIVLDKNAFYKLVVDANGFETATSNSIQIMNPVIIDSIYNNYDSTHWIGYFYVRFSDTNPDYNEYSILINNYSENDSVDSYILGGSMNDEGYSSNTRLFYDDYKKSFNSVTVVIYALSQTLIDFENSYSNYDISYGEKLYESVYPVTNYITNGYGFFAARSISTVIYSREK